MNNYKLGSLFDGSGGFPLAGTLCGIEPVWASEVEPYPIAVTRSRFPNMKHLGDISKINGAEIEPVDVITFGSPCQDLSVAGKQAGLKHTDNGDEETTRSGLFMEAVRIIKEMRSATNGKYPRFALWENVPGAFSSNKGEDFRIVLEELVRIVEPSASVPAVPSGGWNYADSYIGDGWSLAYRVLDAQYWGVPQRRRRIYLVADFRGECAREVLFEREGLRGYFTQGRTPWQAAPAHAEGSPGADDQEGEACGGGHGGGGRQLDAVIAIDKESYSCGEKWDRAPGIAIGGPCATLQTSGTPHAVCYAALTYDARGNGDGATANTITGDHENRVTDYTSVVIEPVAFAQNQRDEVRDLGDKAGAVQAQPGMKQQTFIAEPVVYGLDRTSFNQGQNAKYDFSVPEDQSPTLTARGPGAVSAPPRYIVRRLTPTECARLQGFPDTWGNIDPKNALTEEEYRFWLEVRNTHARINGKKEQEYTAKQMLTWYNKLWTDSAEYKMWGNGIALPTALYVVQGIANALEAEEEIEAWML